MIVKCKGRKQLYHKYKYRAKRKKFDWALTHDEFDDLVQMSCHYCGAEPGLRIIHAAGESVETLAVGVDRIDSAEGYTADNVVPACWICNNMKSTLTTDEFIEHVRRIVLWADTSTS